MRLCLSIFVLLIGRANATFSQVESVNSYTREFSLTIDNDILFFNDWYYSAGHELVYRRLVKPESSIHQFFNQQNAVSSKILIAFTYGNKIFTPRETSARITQKMDRPYAGWNYGGFSITRLKGLSTISHLEAEVGVVGEISGMGQIQSWWHQRVGFPEPRGWNTQISNEVVLNINYQLSKSIKVAPEIDFVFTSGVFGGTGLNKLSQDFTVRLINFNPLTQSTWFDGRLGYNGTDNKEEIFLFINYGIDYIISNIFLEGSLFDNPSPFIVSAETWVLRRSFGLMHSRDRSSFAFEVNNSSREVENGNRHGYARIAYSLRFR